MDSSGEARPIQDHPSSHNSLAEREGGDKRITDDFVSISESVDFLVEIDQPFYRFFKEIMITEVPISGNEKEVSDIGCFYYSFEERQEILADEGLLIWNHVLIAFRRRKGGEEVPP